MSASRIGSNPFHENGGGAKRFNEVDDHQVHRLKATGASRPRRWFQNPWVVLTVALVGFWVFITVFFAHLETVPYTKRKHFVLFSRSMERKMVEAGFQMIRRAFSWKMLPAIHPESVRLRLISEDIIEALQRGLKKGQAWTDLW